MPKGVYERGEKIEGGEEVISGVGDASGNDRIAALESLVRQQSEQLATLTESLSKAKVNKPKRVVENTAKMMFVGDKVITDFGQVVEKNSTLLVPVTLMSLDGTTEQDWLPYLEALNGNTRFVCQIVSQQAHEETTHQGAVPVEFQTIGSDPVGTRESGHSLQVKSFLLDHTYVTYTAKVRFVDGPWAGKEIEVDTKCLNP